MGNNSKQELLEQIAQLQARLDEAEETLQALRRGEVDAIVVSSGQGEHIYTLKGADEAYRVMVENMAEGALTLTPDGLILFSNEQFACMVGMPLEQVIGTSVRNFGAVEDAFVLSAVLSTSTRAEAQLRLKRGSAGLVPVHLSANRLWFEGMECVSLIITDLTEQKRNEEIVAAERLARSILDQTAGALLVIDPTGKIIRASRAAEKLAKRPVLLQPFDEVFALRLKSDAIAEAASINYTFAEIFSTVQRHGTVPDVEAIAHLPEERMLDVILSAGVLTGANDECLGCIVLISDVTNVKRAEQEIRRLNAELEQRVRSRTSELEAANKELEAFAYSVAHDLHSPLRGIDGWSLAILEDYGSQLDARGREYLERVRFEAQHMGQLIDGLLQLSRIGRAELELRPADLSSLAQSIAARLQEANSDRPLEFVIQPELQATADGGLLEIVLTNLLDNAVKFTRHAQPARIEIGKLDHDGEAAFFVRDNGIGFDMQYAQRLFGTFQRLHKSTEFPGTGIGLATVKRIVDRHGGQAWAEGRVGDGASFYFTLGSIR